MHAPRMAVTSRSASRAQPNYEPQAIKGTTPSLYLYNIQN
jgi:hypothetical protein